jgi:oligosaccharide repeat unit polymerase
VAEHSSFPGLILVISLCFLIAQDCSKGIGRLVSARNVFLLTIFAWYGLEGSLVPDKLNLYSSSEFLIGLSYVAMSVVAFLVGYSQTRARFFDTAFSRLARIDRPSVVFVVFLFALCIGFLPLVVLSKGNLLLILQDAFVPARRWSGPFQRGRFGGARDAFLELQMFLRAALPLAAAILFEKRQSSFCKAIAFMFSCYMISKAVNDGTRSKVVEVFLPFAGAIYWRLPRRLKRIALILGLPVLIVLGLLWSAATVLGRNEGTLKWEDAASAEYVGFEMFRELLYLARAVPEHTGYQYGFTYYVQLVNPIPRALWPGKPVGDAGLVLAEMQGQINNGRVAMTVAPGLLGEMYWNFGLLGIIGLSAVLGSVAKAWDRARAMASESLLTFTVYAAGLALIFVTGRSFNMNIMYGMLSLYSLLILFGQRRIPSRQAIHSGAHPLNTGPR